MFAPGNITLIITGGTSGKWQASVDYLQNILIPHLKKFVKKIELKILKRGYYPKGGGKIQLDISPKLKLNDFPDFLSFYQALGTTIPAITLTEQGTLEVIKGVVNLSNELEEKNVGERIMQAAISGLKRYNVPTPIRIEYADSLSVGGELLLWAIFSSNGNVNEYNPIILGGDALIERGKTSEQVAKEAVNELAREIDAHVPVDHYLADQLISFMALLPGSTIVVRNVSSHTRTNIHIAEQFLPVKFTTTENSISVAMSTPADSTTAANDGAWWCNK
jgi:RNA 3'-phosphate cyclase